MRGKAQIKKLTLGPTLFGTAVLGLGLVWSASGVAEIRLEGIQPSGKQPTQLTVSHDEVVNRSPAIGPDLELGDVDLVRGPEFPARRSVLVYLDPAAGDGAERAAANRVAVREFAANVGGMVHYEYKVLPNLLNLRDIPATAVAQLEKMPGVQRVEEDTYDIRINLDESTPLIRGLQSQITGAGLSADGAGARICVVDTGIDSDHIMYADRIDASASYDFYNDDPNPEDDHGHGTHVSGIALGGTGLSVDFGCEGSEPFQGVAPEATLIGVKVLNSWGGGYDSDIIAGIDHCADQSPSGGRADVINLSIGTGQYSGPCSHSWAVAANNAVANGVVVVAASGNDNYSNAMSSPACGIDVIAVGATYKDSYPSCEDSTSTFYWSNCTDVQPDVDQVVCFSNESDYLDVAAPGSDIWSASNASGGSSITQMSGTSMASPHVAGLAALVLSADPSLTPAEVRQVIRDGAIDMGATGFDRGYGYGRVDAINSLQLVSGPECYDDPDCDDGLWCNGSETCVSGSCQPGSDPCPGQDCDEANDICVPLVCNNNGVCESGEDCYNCPNDCISGDGAVCGNGVCETADGEDCVSCPADCNGVQTGKPSGRWCCGDGDGVNPVGCDDPRCTDGGNSCTDIPAPPFCCGDLVCEGGEDGFTCEIDCGAPPHCGDGTCDPGEDQCSCPDDCGTPPPNETNCADEIDEDCDGFADCDDGDCASDPACACLPRGAACILDDDCCSGRCHRGACK